jgi:hypothetical protein
MCEFLTMVYYHMMDNSCKHTGRSMFCCYCVYGGAKEKRTAVDTQLLHLYAARPPVSSFLQLDRTRKNGVG